MLEKVRDFVRKYKLLDQGDTVLIGVSGGPDSTALAYMLKALEEDYNLNLHIFHLNHQLRGREAEEDARFVEKLAGNLKIPVTIEKFDVAFYIEEEKLSLQEGARNIRFMLMEKKAQEINATKIAIGQNADDQAETILMRFLRGTGSKGLSGILPIRDGGYIRPLLEVWRAEIEDFLQASDIVPRLDESNLKPVYLRNKIRLELIPYLRQEYNSNISKVLNQMGSVFREENNYLEEVTENILADIIVDDDGKIEVERKGFLKQHVALQRRLLTLLWGKITKETSGLNYTHIEQGMKHISKGQVGTRFNLPKGFWLVNDYNTFYLGEEREEIRSSLCSQIKVPGVTEIFEKGIRLETEIKPYLGTESCKLNLRGEIQLDYELLANKKLMLRTRISGDRFKPLRGSGSKKLKEYFIDSKIPRRIRDEIPLITMDDQVLWVVGYSINDTFKVTPATKNIITIKLDKN